MMLSSLRWLAAPALVLVVTSSSAAQYAPWQRSAPAAAERYRAEFAVLFWEPTPELLAQSAVFGIVGTTIDLAGDLGMEKGYLPEFRGVLRAARKHKFRVSYIPIHYSAETVLERTIIFNGTVFRLGVPVASDFEWKAWRFGYEWDFVSRDRGYVGLLVEAKYTDVKLALDATGLSEATSVTVPIPAVGGTFRVYPAPNFSLTGEVTGFTLPGSLTQGDETAEYLDWDLYATLNFSRNVGIQGGYRTLEVGYRDEDDYGDFKLKGFYFGGVVRF